MDNVLSRLVLGACVAAAGGGLRADQPLDALLEQKQGVEFRLTRLTAGGESVAIPPGVRPTLTLLPQNRVAGFAGVNRYFGAFRTAGLGPLHWVGPGFGATLMAGPKELMEFEARFLRALHATQTVSIDGGALRFENADRGVVVEFVSEAGAEPVAEMLAAGVKLVRLVVDGESVELAADSRITMRVVNGQVAGSAGVNWFRGAVRLGLNGQISFGDAIATTRRAGTPEAMTLEAKFLRGLGEVARAENLDGTLLLSSLSGTTVMEFVRGR